MAAPGATTEMIEELASRITATIGEIKFLRDRSGEQISIDADELADLHDEVLGELKDQWLGMTGRPWIH